MLKYISPYACARDAVPNFGISVPACKNFGCHFDVNYINTCFIAGVYIQRFNSCNVLAN